MNLFGLSFVLFILKWSAGKGFWYLTQPTITFFVPQMKKNLSKTTTAKLYPTKKWEAMHNVSMIIFTLLLPYNAKYV